MSARRVSTASSRIPTKSGWPPIWPRDGVRLVLHICGNTTAIMADIATTGATMIEFDYKADMARRRVAAQDVTLVGNVDPSGVMALGTPDQVLLERRRAIEVLGRNGRFILARAARCPRPPRRRTLRR